MTLADTPRRPPPPDAVEARRAPEFAHVDERLVVAVKPAGQLCVPGRDQPDCLAARVAEALPGALAVHRLDMATSGLVVFARGAAMQRLLSTAFAQRRVHKRYEAVVGGLLAADQGEIDLPLGADWPQRPRQRVDHANGKPALTRWRVLSRDSVSGCTRLALEPVTGRTHQLRLHLSAIGHAILGDTLYARADLACAAPRLLLHASALGLPALRPGDTPLQLVSAPQF